MDRRSFLQTSISAIAVSNATSGISSIQQQNLAPQTRLNIKPVMTNIIHTGVWEGPCRVYDANSQ